MLTKKDWRKYPAGNPRRVVTHAHWQASRGRHPSELLWGTRTPNDSLRMATIIVNGGFLAITLNEKGARAFTYLQGVTTGDRRVYFVNRFDMGGISQAPILGGQFMEEFEGSPNDALCLTPGLDNCLYFRMGGHQDNRVTDYNFLTPEETEMTRKRLEALLEAHPEFSENIRRMLVSLNH